MQITLFDENGLAHDAASTVFRRRMDALPEQDLVRFLIVNAGWVSVMVRGNRLAVAARPAVACKAALASAMYFIADAPDGPCGLSIHERGGDPTWVEFSSHARLLTALCNAVDAAQPIGGDRFRRRSTERRKLLAQPALADFLNICDELDGHLDMERLWRCLTNGIKGRFAIVRQDRDAIRIVALGHGFRELARYWPGGLAGGRLQDQPDTQYGRWIAAAYREVVATGSPLIETIDCDIIWPCVGRQRHQYWRVIMPFRSATEGKIALSVTLPDSSISLRKLPDVGIE